MFCELVLAYCRDCFSGITGSSTYGTHYSCAVSKVLSENSRSYVGMSEELRSVFSTVDMMPKPLVRDHTHGVSAANRNTGNALAACIATSSGHNAVSIQGSKADTRNEIEITRAYFWGKDLTVEPRQREKRDGDLLVYIDTDYYLDMPGELARHFKPAILYTFQPSTVARDEGEYKYTFLANGKVSYTVSGGASYEHEVWNYTGDSLGATRYVCGIPVTHTVFSLERRMVDNDHQMILLTPLRKFVGWYAWLAMGHVKTATLKRLNLVERGEFLRLTTNESDGLYVHTARVGGYSVAKVPARVDDAIVSTKSTVAKLQLASIKSKMADNAPGSNVIHGGAEVLLEYHRGDATRPSQVDLLAEGVRRYQFLQRATDLNEDARPKMVAFMHPIVDGGFVPDFCVNNDQRAVDERVKKLAREPEPVLDGFIDKVMNEFVTMFFRQNGTQRKHFLEPLENEVVYERQGRPTQRRILDNAQHESATRRASGMPKSEAYQNPKDPRMITIIEGAVKMEYSSFIYALSDYMKDNLYWYASGMTPQAVAQRVADICEGAMSHVSGTDFERMDGRVKRIARELERRVMTCGFKIPHHLTLLRLMRDHTGLAVRTSNGVKYDSKYARASGGADTAAFNSILNAFIAFMGYRRMKDAYGSFLQKEEAWNRLGIYLGDDGLSADIDRQAIVRSATSMGQKLTMEVTPRGETGVSFLARRYGPDVWFGDTNSCCDIRRAISKLHLTVRVAGNITPEVKLKEKVYALSLTDSETPVCRELVNAVFRLWPDTAESYQNLLNQWNVNIEKSVQYPNTAAYWMDELLQQQLPLFDYEGYCTHMETVKEDAIFTLPAFMDRPTTKPPTGALVAADDDLLEGEPPARRTGDEPAEEERKSPPRKTEQQSTQRSKEDDRTAKLKKESETPAAHQATPAKQHKKKLFRARKKKEARPSRLNNNDQKAKK